MQSVESVEHFKYLSVIVDCDLKFDKHMTNLKCKVYKRLKGLVRLCQYISSRLSLQLYRSLIIPHLDYADVCYDAMNQQCKTVTNAPEYLSVDMPTEGQRSKRC